MPKEIVIHLRSRMLCVERAGGTNRHTQHMYNIHHGMTNTNIDVVMRLKLSGQRWLHTLVYCTQACLLYTNVFIVHKLVYCAQTCLLCTNLFIVLQEGHSSGRHHDNSLVNNDLV